MKPSTVTHLGKRQFPNRVVMAPMTRSRADVGDIAGELNVRHHVQRATDPLASPLYGDGDGLPPVQVHVGTAEIPLNAAHRLATRGPIEVRVWEGMVHVIPRNVATLKAARGALDLSGAYLRERLS